MVKFHFHFQKLAKLIHLIQLLLCFNKKRTTCIWKMCWLCINKCKYSKMLSLSFVFMLLVHMSTATLIPPPHCNCSSSYSDGPISKKPSTPAINFTDAVSFKHVEIMNAKLCIEVQRLQSEFPLCFACQFLSVFLSKSLPFSLPPFFFFFNHCNRHC